MSWTVIIILIVIGLGFLALEVLAVPGSTVVGVMGFIMIGVGIWQAYSTFGNVAGHYTVGGTLVLTVMTLYLSLKSKTWDKMMLKSEIDGKMNVIDEDGIAAGDEGHSVSRLAPSGKASVNGRIYEVHSEGGFVDQNTPIVVLRVKSNKIYVRPK